jgi:hypothetical protein
MAAKKVIARPSAQHYLLKLTTRPNRVCENLGQPATKYHATQPHIDMTKAQRAKLHRSINDLSPQDVAGIVKQSFPRAKGGKIDQLARVVIARAHRQVSPRLPRKTG